MTSAAALPGCRVAAPSAPAAATTTATSSSTAASTQSLRREDDRVEARREVAGAKVGGRDERILIAVRIEQPFRPAFVHDTRRRLVDGDPRRHGDRRRRSRCGRRTGANGKLLCPRVGLRGIEAGDHILPAMARCGGRELERGAGGQRAIDQLECIILGGIEQELLGAAEEFAPD